MSWAARKEQKWVLSLRGRLEVWMFSLLHSKCWKSKGPLLPSPGINETRKRKLLFKQYSQNSLSYVLLCRYNDNIGGDSHESSQRSNETRKQCLSREIDIPSFGICTMKPSMISAKHRHHFTLQQGQGFQTWCARRRTCRIKPEVTKFIRKQSTAPEDLGEKYQNGKQNDQVYQTQRQWYCKISICWLW